MARQLGSWVPISTAEREPIISLEISRFRGVNEVFPLRKQEKTAMRKFVIERDITFGAK